jgi:hypothetical protein
VRPSIALQRFGKACRGQPGLEVGEDRVGDADRERLDRLGWLRLRKEPSRGDDYDSENQQAAYQIFTLSSAAR